MSWPKPKPKPALGSVILLIMEMVVVFPEPFGPKSPKSSSSPTEKEMSSTAIKLLYFL